MGLLSEETGRRLVEAIKADKAKGIEEMPDVQAALRVFTRAYRRLIDLGFREIIYHPKDGATFEVIEPGSTGIHPCQFWTEPARGSFWSFSQDGDCGPAHPVLWRPMQQDPTSDKP
jgi:hypothetical protein